MHFEGGRKVLTQAKKGNELAVVLKCEGWQLRRVPDIHLKSALDSEPHWERSQNRFALCCTLELRANGVHAV
jgi:hypothetical protein